MIIQTPIPTLSCDPSGYLLQVTNLYRVNITTGMFATVKTNLAEGARALKMNAMGYNVGDNFLLLLRTTRRCSTWFGSRVPATASPWGVSTSPSNPPAAK